MWPGRESSPEWHSPVRALLRQAPLELTLQDAALSRALKLHHTGAG
jgi:hypothetical protein